MAAFASGHIVLNCVIIFPVVSFSINPDKVLVNFVNFENLCDYSNCLVFATLSRFLPN